MPKVDDLSPLTAISPIDGRYRSRASALTPITSEYGLMRYRVRVEVAWFIHLAACPGVAGLPALSPHQRSAAEAIAAEFDVADAAAIRDLEAETNHDVKAVEYFVKGRMARIDGLQRHLEHVHFGCTSEDINNLAYALMLRDARDTVLVPAMADLIDALRRLAAGLADVPMLSRTHGQPASPTTVGKELANFIARFDRQLAQIRNTAILGKMNGAVGNYNAHAVAYPDVDWPAESRRFLEALGLATNPYTTQIEPHDYMAELFHALKRFNQVLLDFDRDIWGYIALGYFRQRKVEGETGSSTMPHKVNPIDFENSEGNVGLANALLGHLADKLPVSRWQRDLSDSTALRNVGTALGHCLVAYSSAMRGLGKLAVDHDKLDQDLDDAWEVLAEAVQTLMRANGSPEPYEQLKRLTRGERLDEAVYRDLLDQLDLDDAARERLSRLRPRDYLGLSAELARDVATASPGPRVYEVAWRTHGDALKALRHTVFVEEQGVPEAEEWDGQDEASRHFIAEDGTGTAVGTARLMPSGQIGRMAVLKPLRGKGIGARLLAATVDAARRGGYERIFLHAQIEAEGFYERAGFRGVGETFMEAGIEHRPMELPTET